MALNFPNAPDDGDIYEGYIWNDTVGAWQSIPAAGKANIINTDGDAGITIYVGSIDPDVAYTPVTGDVWIETASES